MFQRAGESYVKIKNAHDSNRPHTMKYYLVKYGCSSPNKEIDDFEFIAK